MIAFEGLDTGKGKNQIGTLQRAGDTRWGSHLTSLRSLLKMFDSTFSVLKNIISDGNLTQRSEADSVYDVMTSFEFVFILHLIQRFIQRFREEGCDTFLEKVAEEDLDFNEMPFQLDIVIMLIYFSLLLILKYMK
ncbi:hypothetical protein V6N13_010222 [Hibiscus sabdariffa]